MIVSPTLFLSLWLMWGVIWLVAASRTARTVSAQSLRSRSLHLGLIGLGAALVFLHFNAPAVLAWRILPDRAGLGWTGFSLLALGLAFAVWARVYLGRFWSGTVTLKEDHALVQTGPYGLTRHPIYTGLLTALGGTALANGTLAAMIGFGLVALACGLKMRLEERVLQAHFGPQYANYRAAVPALIPRPW